MKHFALILGQKKVFLYRVGLTSVELVQSAALADLKIEDWLAAEVSQGSRCTLLTDYLDETYTYSAMPPLWWYPARAQLVARRLNNQYRGAAFRMAMVPGARSLRPPAMASLFNLGQSELINQWLAALEGLGARVDGLWTFASLMAVAWGKKGGNWRLTLAAPGAGPTTRLIVAETSSGLRQVVMRDGLPIFSRLAVQSDGMPYDRQRASEEARRTVQYLYSQEWVPASVLHIDTRLWVGAELDGGGDLPQTLDALQITEVHSTTDAYAMALAHRARLPQDLQLLSPAMRLRWRAHELGRGALIAGTTLLISALLWSGWVVSQTWEQQAQMRQEAAQATEIEASARAERVQAKSQVANSELAEASVATWTAAIDRQPEQLDAMRKLASALATVPGIKISEIRWETRNLAGLVDSAQTPPSAPLACSAALGLAPATPEPPAPVASTPGGTATQVVALLRFKGELPSGLTPRAVVAAQDRLSEALTNKHWRATMQRAAFELDPRKALVGAVGLEERRFIEQCVEVSAP